MKSYRIRWGSNGLAHEILARADSLEEVLSRYAWLLEDTPYEVDRYTGLGWTLKQRN